MKTNSYIQKDDSIYNLNQKKINQPQSIPISNLSFINSINCNCCSFNLSSLFNKSRQKNDI